MMDQLSATGGVKDEKCKGKITEKHVRGMIQFNMQNPIQQQNSEEQECNNNMNLMVDLIRGCLHLLFFFGNNIRITLNVLLSYIITRFFFWQSSKNHLISIFHLNHCQHMKRHRFLSRLTKRFLKKDDCDSKDDKSERQRQAEVTADGDEGLD